MDENELRHSLKTNPDRVMFVFRGHWVAVTLDDPLDPPGDEDLPHRVILDKSNELQLPRCPELVLPAIIEIRNDRLSDPVRMPVKRNVLRISLQQAGNSAANTEIPIAESTVQLFRKLWRLQNRE